MSESLYPYYERELIFIRQLAQDFARQYPAAAGRLLLEPNRSIDPHVERMIEGFALLSARIHHKLDDEFPELTNALLDVLYPHYLAPVPSMAIVQFQLDAARGELPDGFTIEKGSRLHTSRVGNLACKYRTGYPLTLWPIELKFARLQAAPFPAGYQPPPRTAAALRLQFECVSQVKFSDLSLDRLRLYLDGEAQVVAHLYELLFNHALRVDFRPLDGPRDARVLSFTPRQTLSQVGFEADEGLLPYPARSFIGYRLLSEFFAFPSKFLFLDLGGWKEARRAGLNKQVEVVIYLGRSGKIVEQGVDAATFALGCTPVVNLFEQVAEPINVNHTRHEYRVVPDVAHPQGMEVYAIDSVTSADPAAGVSKEFVPFYAFRHRRTPESQAAFWYASRRPSRLEGDRGIDTYLALVDHAFNPCSTSDITLLVRTTCTNRNLPNQLQMAGDSALFELEAAAPLARIRCLRSPTSPLRPPLRRGAYWGLISHLNLNHLSISASAEGREALQQILRLYDFSDPAAGQQQMAEVTQQLIEGITAVSSSRVVGRAGASSNSGFCRGIEIKIEFDEQMYIGTGVFLFASVLERFLALYTSINSFSQLAAATRQREGIIKKWPPRSGELQLL
jgi:type VI secretion system protein ImpG